MVEVVIALAAIAVTKAAISAVESIISHFRNKYHENKIIEAETQYRLSDEDLAMAKASGEVIRNVLGGTDIGTLLIEMPHEDRICAVREIMEGLCGIYGIPAPTLKYFHEGAELYTCGGYSSEEDIMYLNLQLLALDSTEDLQRLVLCCAHELRHKYQNCAVTGTTTRPVSEETVARWKKNFGNYVQPEIDLVGYFRQPVEIDARVFAQQAIKEVGTHVG